MGEPRVVIAHDYLTQKGGAERVVLAMMRAFPDAPVYTTLFNPETTYPEFDASRIRTSWLNRFGVFRRDHRLALPVLALVASTFRVDADVVVVSSSGWAHGFATKGRRLVYCYSPARWLYQTERYLGGKASGSVTGWVLLALRPFLKVWDKRQARKAAKYLAISRVVQGRITDSYGISSEVVGAPHSFDASLPSSPVAALADWDEGFHLVVSRLLPYKNVGAVVDAFRELPDARLVIVGSGPLREELAAALPGNVRLLSGLSDEELRWTYQHCTAVIAPSFEDYGLTPLEAGVYGRPTIALRAGGYLDTIVEGVTGTFFDEPTAGAIGAAVRRRPERWDEAAITSHVDGFSERVFADRLRAEVASLATPLVG